MRRSSTLTNTQILEREVGYIFPLMEVEPTICIELKNEEDEG